jgi:hypothetical protein
MTVDSMYFPDGSTCVVLLTTDAEPDSAMVLHGEHQTVIDAVAVAVEMFPRSIHWLLNPN